MAYDPNDTRKSFEYDEFSRRPSLDPTPAGFTGLIIGAIVVLGALIAFLMFRNDTETTQIGMNNPPVTQTSPSNPNPASPPAAIPNPPAPAPSPTVPAPTTSPPANN